MSAPDPLEDLLAAFIERHQRDGAVLPAEALAGERGDLVGPLRAAIARYLELEETGPAGPEGRGGPPPSEAPLPRIDGFRTIERIGRGGTGEVYKLEDLKLGRPVAAKVVRRDLLGRGVAGFLQEARALALFQDPRIVRIYECRTESDPPVILMEHVDGFELGDLAPSLEPVQRARILAEVAEALDHAHRLGIQHRDLKPSNLMLDAQLRPRILDFGLAAGDPARGHLVGTLGYLAPEQLDPVEPIDARTDVYALGVILYELLCGRLPYAGRDTAETLRAIRLAEPRLPVEVDPEVPEPLQAIALKAMERDPGDRYPTALDLARDLRRFVAGEPVLARPRAYASALGRRLEPQVAHIEEWLRLKLIYPHEAEDLRRVYRRLEAREDDWIVASRVLSWSQILLYLGAFLLFAGGLLYFAAHRFHGAARGLALPLLALGGPVAVLGVAARWLERSERRAVGLAFQIGGLALLPLGLLIAFHELGWWRVGADSPGQIFLDGSMSNRQLQMATLATLAWAAWLARRSRTTALGSLATGLLGVSWLALLGDLGLRGWLDGGRFDLLAFHLAPLPLLMGALGAWLEGRDQRFLSQPLYLGAAFLLVAVTELLALDGKTFHHLGISLAPYQAKGVEDPLLLDTLAAMGLNGILYYGIAWVLDRSRSDLRRGTAFWLFAVSPFATLEPVAWLNHTGEYGKRWLWVYLALAVLSALLARYRQRRSFYYAGLVNTAFGLWLVSDRYGWFDEPLWASVVIGCGLVGLLAGLLADRAGRGRQAGPPGAPR